MKKVSRLNAGSVIIFLSLFLILGCKEEAQLFDPQCITGELVNGLYILESMPTKAKFRVDIGESATFYSSRTLGWTNITKQGELDLKGILSDSFGWNMKKVEAQKGQISRSMSHKIER